MSLTPHSCALPQTEKAYQKQLGVNGGWRKPARKTPGKGGARYYKNVGLGFKTPKEAIEGGNDEAASFSVFRGRALLLQMRSVSLHDMRSSPASVRRQGLVAEQGPL